MLHSSDCRKLSDVVSSGVKSPALYALLLLAALAAVDCKLGGHYTGMCRNIITCDYLYFCMLVVQQDREECFGKTDREDLGAI